MKRQTVRTLFCLALVFLISLACGDPEWGFVAEDPRPTLPPGPDAPEQNKWSFAGTGTYTMAWPADGAFPAGSCGGSDATIEMIVWANGEVYMDAYHPNCAREGHNTGMDFQGTLINEAPDIRVRWNTCLSFENPASGTVTLDTLDVGLWSPANGYTGNAICGTEGVTWTSTYEFTVYYKEDSQP